jgi:CheY-like chemotaxis protein
MSNPTPLTVLYVDDDQDDQEFFITSLAESRPGGRCYVAKDSKSAFEIIQTIPTPDYIFIDLHLPKVNGIELLRGLKNIDTYSRIPSYILSTSLFEPYAAVIKEIGGNGFMKKPSSLADFKAMLDSVLK